MKLSAFWEKLYDKKTFVVAFILFVTFAVPGSTPIAGVTQTATDRAVIGNIPPELVEALDYPCPNTVETYDGRELKVLCNSGFLPSTWDGINAALGGGRWDELFLATDDELSPEQQASMLRDLNDRTSSSLIGISRNASYAMVEQRPLSGLIFAEETVAQVILPNTALAQESQNINPYFPGTGFELLRPIQTLWSYLVYISYSFMIVLVLVIAFALMFRARLNGDQTVQLQTAIPGIVAAMILIPLSYPISGLFIDGITLGANAVHGIMFGPLGVFEDVYNDEEQPLSDFRLDEQDINRGLYIDDPRLNIFGFSQLIGAWNEETGIRETLESSICSGLLDVGESCDAAISNATWGSVVRWIVGFLNNVLFESMAIAFFLAFQLLALFTALRIAWKLFKQFLTLMILPVASPIIFATLAIPGRGNELVKWYLKRMGNATLNFVVVYAVLLLAAVFASPAVINILPQDSVEGLSAYEPPLIAGSIFGNLVGTANNAADSGQEAVPILFLFLSVGIYFVSPGILQSITDALAPKEENPFVKLFTQEVKTTSQLGFAQAAAGVSAAKTAAYNPVTRWAGGGLQKRVFGGKESRFDSSRGERLTKGVAGAASRFANSRLSNLVGGKENARRIAGAVTGATSAVTGAEVKTGVGEKPGFEVELNNSSMAFVGRTQYNVADVSGNTIVISDDAARRGGPASAATLTGQITIKVDTDKNTVPVGDIEVASNGSGTYSMFTLQGTGGVEVEVIAKDLDSGLSPKSKGSAITYSGPDARLSFTQNKRNINFEVKLPASVMKPNTRLVAKGGKGTKIGVGDGGIENFSFTIKVSN